MISHGFSVTSVDGSAQMAKQAEKLIGRPVAVFQFHDLEARDEFNGIWASASLLHVPRSSLPSILNLVKCALKDGAIFYASFKSGENEGRDQFDRYYNYPTEDFLKTHFTRVGWKDFSITQSNGGGYDGQPTAWLHVTAIK